MAQSWLERAQRAEQKERGSAPGSLVATIGPQKSETSKSTRDNGSNEPDRH
jgi:hypothetical protein